MHIEHCHFLSWFSASSESHEQDGERLRFQATASGDPAHMRFEPCTFARGDPYRLLLVAGGGSPPDQISER
jgi:hypothetical protein